MTNMKITSDMPEEYKQRVREFKKWEKHLAICFPEKNN